MNSNKLTKSIAVLLSVLLINSITVGQAVVNENVKINFTNFKLNHIHNKIAIDWGTDNNAPANYFEIERSSDGVNFKTIAMVLGPDPKQPGCDCYECFDKPDFRIKKYYYRLKHIGINGEIELSETRMLAIHK
jgi:hypothetical protein